jgi:hypothetical protein
MLYQCYLIVNFIHQSDGLRRVSKRINRIRNSVAEAVNCNYIIILEGQLYAVWQKTEKDPNWKGAFQQQLEINIHLGQYYQSPITHKRYIHY